MVRNDWTEVRTEEQINQCRIRAKIPDEFTIEPAGNIAPTTGTLNRLPFSTLALYEGGITFPLHPLLIECLVRWKAFPTQCSVNVFRIIMGVVALNRNLNLHLGYPEIMYCYNVVRAKKRPLHLQLKPSRNYLVTDLPDSSIGKDRHYVYISGPLMKTGDEYSAFFPTEFGSQVRRRNTLSPLRRPHKEILRLIWSRIPRSAHLLLGYTPRYKSFGSRNKKNFEPEPSKSNTDSTPTHSFRNSPPLIPIVNSGSETMSGQRKLLREKRVDKEKNPSSSSISAHPDERTPNIQPSVNLTQRFKKPRIHSPDRNTFIIREENSQMFHSAPFDQLWIRVFPSDSNPILVSDTITNPSVAQTLAQVLLLPVDVENLKSKSVEDLKQMCFINLAQAFIATEVLFQRASTLHSSTNQEIRARNDLKEENSVLERDISALIGKLDCCEQDANKLRIEREEAIRNISSISEKLGSSEAAREALQQENANFATKLAQKCNATYNRAMDDVLVELEQVRVRLWKQGFRAAWLRASQLSNEEIQTTLLNEDQFVEECITKNPPTEFDIEPAEEKSPVNVDTEIVPPNTTNN